MISEMSTYNLIIEISERKRTREKRGRTDQYEKTTVPKRTRSATGPLPGWSKSLCPDNPLAKY